VEDCSLPSSHFLMIPGVPRNYRYHAARHAFPARRPRTLVLLGSWSFRPVYSVSRAPDRKSSWSGHLPVRWSVLTAMRAPFQPLFPSTMGNGKRSPPLRKTAGGAIFLSAHGSGATALAGTVIRRNRVCKKFTTAAPGPGDPRREKGR